MIRVHKPSAPKKLNEGKELTKVNCELYDTNKIEYQEGRRKFKLNDKIYGHKTVKEALKSAQFQKCCFCEGKFSANAPGDVEHFRPKGAVQHDENSRRELPGYFWLAYSWENLYWSCQVCNRSNKKSFFPLRNPDLRARSCTDNLSLEEPLILNPGGSEDPREHIKFRGELALGESEAGTTTIRVLGLNRPELIEARRARLAQLRTFVRIIRLSKESGSPECQELEEDAIEKLTKWVRTDAMFSAMAIDALNEDS